jgi:hypothetical protein
VVVLTVGGGPGIPTAASAATLALRAPLHSVGSEVAQTETLSWPTAGGLAFPAWVREYGFRAVGTRVDRLGDRTATTVFYDRDGARVAYTIVTGHALARGADASQSMLRGTRLWSFTKSGRAVVTWLRGGHTCVLSGDPGLLSELQRLAAWKPHTPAV